MTFWLKALALPPILVRLLAADHRERQAAPLSDLQIAERSGLTPAQVHAISWSTTWSGIDLPTMHKFLVGCGVDFENRAQWRRHQVYLKSQVKLAQNARPSWAYLRRSPDWKTLYAPMMRAYQQSLSQT